MSRIVDRILRKCGVPDLVEILSERLGATDLQSLLLEVFRRRAAGAGPAELMGRYEKSRFSRPSSLAATALLELDALAFSLLPDGFEDVELSPVAPLGATAIVTGTSQNRIVSTVRNSEVASDSTNAMALECARRRRERLAAEPRSTAPVKLAASQRLVRAQHGDDPRQLAHFRLLGLCSAGRDTGSFRFELESLSEQIGFHLRLLEGWRARGGRVGRIRVPVTPLDDGPPEGALREQVLDRLAAAHPRVDIAIDRTRQHGRGYYRSACFNVYAQSPDGSDFQLADGGFTDWTQQLVGSRKERLMISGLGCERLVEYFSAGADPRGSAGRG